jgi:putative PEP-CTERM system TPR-repeat lipoprotein
MRPIPTNLFALLLLISSTQSVAAQDLALAERYWREGALVEASLTLKAILQKQADDADARLLLARLYLDLRDGQAAEQALNRADAAAVSSAELASLTIRALLQQGAFARALDAASGGARTDDSQARAEVLALRAEAHRGLGDMEQAQITVDQALQAAPGSIPALIERARQEAALNTPDRARETLSAALALAPNDPEALMAAAELAMAQRRFADADRWLTNALSTVRQRWWANYLRALTRIELGELDAAQADIVAGRSQHPRFLGFDYAAAQLAARRGHYAAALAGIERFLKANPRDPGATLLAAQTALLADQPERALTYVTTHLAVAPGSRNANLLLAQAYAALGRFDAAEDILEPMLSAESPPADALRALGSVRLLQGNAQGAVEALRSAAQARPDDADLRVELAKALMRAGDANAAARELDAALLLRPDHVSALLERVRLAVADDDPEVGLRAAVAFLAQHPENPYALTAAAAARARAGDPVGARAALEQALAIDPGFADAGLSLARLELSEGNAAAARSIYEALLAEAPEDESAILALTQLEVANGDNEVAMRRLEAALSRNPGSLDLRLNLARGYQSAGRGEEAAALLRALPPSVAADVALLRERAAAELTAGDLDAAALTYESLLRASPDDPLPRYQLATVLAAAGRPATAGDVLARGFELDPEHGAAVHAVAAVFDATRDIAARSQLLERLELNGGNSALVRLFRARSLREQGDLDAAAEQLRDIEVAASSDARFVDLLVREQRAAGESIAAIRTAKAWLARHPDDVDTQRRLAQLLAESGSAAAAIVAYKAVLDRAPEDMLALNNLALLLLERAPREALTYAVRARQAAPDVPAVADTLGTAQLAAGETAAAVQTLRGAHEALPASGEVALHYAQALAAAGEYETARQILLPLAAKSFAGADAAQELLRSLDGE